MNHFLKEIIDSDISISEKIDYLKLDREFLGPSKKYDELFTARINSLLQVSKTRLTAFNLINEFIQYSSEDLLANNACQWLSACLNFIQSKSSPSEIAYVCILKILIHCKDFPSVKKKVSLANISPLLEFICKSELALQSIYPAFIFQVLFACVECYPGSCGTRKDLIHNFVIDHLLTSDQNSRKVLANIFSKLYNCPGKKSNIQKNLWLDQMETMIITLDSLLDVYRHHEIVFLDDILTSREISPIFKPMDKDSIQGLMTIKVQFEFVSSVISKMLVDSVSEFIDIPVQAILVEIIKICSVNSEEIRNSNVPLGCIIPSLQYNALVILYNLIKSCNTTLAVHSRIIIHLFTRILKNSTLDASSRCLNNLKSKCYEAIELWFDLVGPNVVIDKKSSDIFLKHFMRDIKPQESVVQLRDSKVRKVDSEIENSFNSDQNGFFFDLVHQSLKALKSFVRNTIMLMSETYQQTLVTFILDETLASYRTPNQRQLFRCNAAFRIDLLSLVLLMSLKCQMFPISTAVLIFSEALKTEKNHEVKRYCLESLASLNCLINPVRHVKVDEK